jgi:hypothetical protein
MAFENSHSASNDGLSNRVKAVVWPALDDQNSTVAAVSRASKWVFGWAVLLVAIGLLDLLIVSFVPASSKPPGTTVASAFIWYAIAVGMIFAFIGWRIKKMSLAWAIAGFLLCVLAAAAVFPSPIAIVIYLFLILMFVNAVRATYKYKKCFSGATA